MSKKPPTVKDRAALDAAKLRLRDYLIANGFDPSKNMHCIFHSPDAHPSMSLLPDGQAVHCFGCGITADIVNVIAQLEGFAPNSKEAIKRAIEFAGTAPVQSSVQSVERKKKGTDPQKHNWTSALKSKPCVAYLHSRGFSGDDKDSIDKYNVAFDKANNCLIIPHDGDYYTARAIGNISKDARFVNNPSTSVTLFNGNAIDNERVVAVCEGAIDALSLICCGMPAVATGGAQTQSKFINALKKAQKLPDIILAFDTDKTGVKAADKLSDNILKTFDVRIAKLNLQGASDVNELFCKDRAKLQEAIKAAVASLKDRNDSDQTDNPSAEEVTGNPILDFQQQVVADFHEAKKRSIKERQLNQRRAELGINTTDAGIAEQIILHFAKDFIRYNSESSRFMLYHAPIWQELNKDSELRTLIRQYRQSLIDSPDEELYQHVIGCLTSEKKIPKVIAYMRSFDEIYINNADLNNHSFLLPCKNGVVDLKTGTLLPHDPNLLWTRTANFLFDPDAKSELWDHFIASIIPDAQTRIGLQRYLGYCLTGSVKEEKALFVVGSGGNGKGTLFRTVMNLLGDFATPLRIDALLAHGRTAYANAASPEFAKLEFVRCAVAEEIPKNQKMDSAQFKLLTGGDYLPVRRLYREASIIKNVSHKLILSGNALPRLDDPNDKGLLRRLLVVEFKQSFTDDQCDPELKHKLNQPDVLSAIFNWLLDGCLQWQLHGLLVSKEMQRDRQAYLDDNDALADFIEDYCKLGKNFSVKRKDFLEAVKQHGSVSLRFMNDKDIEQRLRAVEGVDYKRKGSGYVFTGIRLLNEQELQRSIDDDTDTGEETVSDLDIPI